MYNLPEYKTENQQQVIEFMHNHPFVVLNGCDASNKPVATQAPLLIKERAGKIFLQGHIMRGTDHYIAFQHNPNVLALFNGPHTYVSASWYTNPLQGSTWNYVTVQAKGILSFVEEATLINILRETTFHFENNVNSPSLFEHLPVEYVEKLTKAIAGFEIEVQDIGHVFKLSQNRDAESYENIIQHLIQGDDDAKKIALLMKTNRPS
jgi:transcriptional regulator